MNIDSQTHTTQRCGPTALRQSYRIQTERDDDKFLRRTMRVNYADVVPTFVDMDHLLSGTTYDKAPRGRAITIESPTLQRHRSNVVAGTGHTRPKHAGEAQKGKVHPVMRKHLFDAR